MPLAPATAESIRRNAELDLFEQLNPQFDMRSIVRPLDLSGDTGADPFLAGSNWANVDTRGSGAGSKALREFINSKAGRAEIARSNPTVAAELADEEAGEIAEAFVASTPAYYADPDNRNYETMVAFLARTQLGRTNVDPDDAVADLQMRGLWNVENLQTAFAQLSAAGKLIPKPGARKTLSDEELTRVVACLRCEDAGTALLQYVSFALGGLSSGGEYDSPTDLLAAFPELSSEAALFIWVNLRLPDESDMREFEKTLKGRRILSVDALDTLYAAWEKKRGLTALFAPDPADEPTAENFENMTDGQIKALMQQSILEKNRARRQR